MKFTLTANPAMLSTIRNNNKMCGWNNTETENFMRANFKTGGGTYGTPPLIHCTEHGKSLLIAQCDCREEEFTSYAPGPVAERVRQLTAKA